MFTAGFVKKAGAMDAIKDVATVTMRAARTPAFQAKLKGNAVKGAIGGGLVGAGAGAMSKDQNGNRGGIGGAIKGGLTGAAAGGALGAASPYADTAWAKGKKLVGK